MWANRNVNSFRSDYETWKSKDHHSRSNVNSGDHECLYQLLDGPSSRELQEWVIKFINNKEYISIFALPVSSSHRLRVFYMFFWLSTWNKVFG